ncbi:hypothetical protein PHMEG_00010245 [Phytophthora megakarya]|uniref:Integrase catalytic domain-containing protein n=1 Tax=Phytophthora megakarya TaxID=4795 RepID=A0A225WEI7_9STRA|nr:hypothetical protein PHMEG_00010245 [Phytophthora megakarya]
MTHWKVDIKECSSKSKPQLRRYSPGNILAERPFQIVSMDFVIPLPKSRRGNTALVLFQFVIAKPMSDTTARKVAQVFEECIYQRFGVPSLIRHDRDLRFMSEVVQAFAEMMQTRSRATLSYRPQAKSTAERSVKTVMQYVKVYVEDPLRQDWDEIAEHQVFAINNSIDTTSKETPFYLVHRWDASSTMKAMTTSHQDPTRQCGDDSVTQSKSSKKLFEAGSRVWLYMERVKAGLTKKLAHRWHGPFRIKKKVDEFAFELELSDKGGNRFYPLVHISRLKPVNEFSSRTTTQLAPEVAEDSRMEFDEALLPEDSWEPDHIMEE